MAHHRNLAIDQGAHYFDTLGTPLEFDSVGPALQEASGITNRLRWTEMEAKKGHIGHEQDTRLCAYNGFEVMVHHRHAHRQCIIESKTDVADAIPDKDDISDRIGDACRNRVVSGGHRDTTALLLPSLQEWNRDAFNRQL
ncbi:hypothetical protein ABIB85_004409 [Bradyrhizobium sp. JR1.5]